MLSLLRDTRYEKNRNFKVIIITDLFCTLDDLSRFFSINGFNRTVNLPE